MHTRQIINCQNVRMLQSSRDPCCTQDQDPSRSVKVVFCFVSNLVQ